MPFWIISMLKRGKSASSSTPYFCLSSYFEVIFFLFASVSLSLHALSFLCTFGCFTNTSHLQTLRDFGADAISSHINKPTATHNTHAFSFFSHSRFSLYIFTPFDRINVWLSKLARGRISELFVGKTILFSTKWPQFKESLDWLQAVHSEERGELAGSCCSDYGASHKLENWG